MTISVDLADANILFSRTLRDYFLYLADEGAIEIRWSQQILDDMSRNLRETIGLSQADADRLEALMNEYIDTRVSRSSPRTWQSFMVSRWTRRTAMSSRRALRRRRHPSNREHQARPA